MGKRPYKTGEPCSQCQDDALFCIDGECGMFVGQSACPVDRPAIERKKKKRGGGGGCVTAL